MKVWRNRTLRALSFVAGTFCGISPVQAVEITPVGYWSSFQMSFPRRMVVVGTHAYITSGDGLHVFGIAQVAAPFHISGTTNSTFGIAFSGGHLYVTGSGGFQVLDLADPTKPVRVGGLTNIGSSGSLAVSGNYAYLAESGVGTTFQVIDISDPTNPLRVASTNMSGSPLRVAVSGNYAYVGSGFTLRVINIADPLNPVLMGGIYLTNSPSNVSVSGSYAYVAVQDSGLHVIDVSDPANPVRLGGVNTSGSGDIALSGNYAYCTVGLGGLDIIDVSNPTNPFRVGNLPAAFTSAYSISLSGSYAWLLGSSGIQVVDITDPTRPRAIGGLPTASYVFGVALSGAHAYVADEYAGLQIVDVSNPFHATRAGGYVDYRKRSYPFDIAVSGSHAYMLDYSNGLQVFSITNPANPVLLGSCAVTNTPRRFAVSGDKAYVSVDRDYYKIGMAVIDLGIVTNPVNVATYWVTNLSHAPSWVQAGGLVISNNYAYLTYGGQWHDPEFGETSFGDMQIVNVSNPSNPVFTGHVIQMYYDYESWDVALAGNYAYPIFHYAARASFYPEDGGLAVVDINNPTNPFWVSNPQSSYLQYKTKQNHSQVLRADNKLYLLGGSPDLRVVDISNPTNLTLAASANTGALRMDVSGHYAYMASGAQGLQIYCLDCPRLSAEPAGSQILLKWPPGSVAYSLESAQSIVNPQWQGVPGTPQLINGFYQLLIPAQPPGAFLRLRGQ